MKSSEHGPNQVNSFPQARSEREPGVGLLEPVPTLVGFDDTASSGGWREGHGPSLAEHPLLRGLLYELPPKGTQPAPEWMNRWFEAARAVLDLIYNRR